jgi:hypothetical protein
MEKALGVFTWVAEMLPGSTFSAHLADTWYYRGQICRYVYGWYKEAAQCYQQVVTNWPGYKYAREAQFRIGDCYERMMSLGWATESEARPKIEQAYKATIDVMQIAMVPWKRLSS